MREVAKSDDPGAFADNAAQIAAVPTGATAADNAYVAQFRAALENGEIEVASAVLTAIDSMATDAPTHPRGVLGVHRIRYTSSVSPSLALNGS